MSDRTGELCPFCGKGKLYPTGGREIREPAPKPEIGETGREHTEYECDSCHRMTEARAFALADRCKGTDSIQIEKIETKEKEGKT
jgi:hypothetical protein